MYSKIYIDLMSNEQPINELRYFEVSSFNKRVTSAYTWHICLGYMNLITFSRNQN